MQRKPSINSFRHFYLMILILLCASSALAFKQGSIDLIMQTPQGDVSVKLKISPEAVRSNILLGLGQFKMDMTFLIKTEKGAELFQINDAAKTYSLVSLNQSPPSNIRNEKVKNSQSISYANVKVKSLGEAKILGYKVKHLSVTADNFTSEIWLCEDIEIFSTLKKLQKLNQNNSNQLEIFKALEKNNHKGFPMKMWWKEKGGPKMEMYVNRIKEETFPATLFEIPKDYKKTSGGSSLASPQTMQGVQNILENMTPEQKKALQEMITKQK